jgi:GNAT superfamily N-acetyltransferase
MNTTQVVDRRSRSLAPSLCGVALRRSGAGDAASLTEMLAGLSPMSSYLRFLSGGRPSDRMVARLLHRDSTHGAWLATAGDLTVGHVMWALAPDGAVEVGVVVSDAWQHRGIGRWLIQSALAEAAVAGAVAVRLNVHTENGRVIGMLRRSMPDAVVTRDAGMLTYLAPMRSATTPS